MPNRPEHQVEIKLTEALEAAAELGNEVNRLRREIEILSDRNRQAFARVDFWTKLVGRFWRIIPGDIKAPDGRTLHFVDPDPHRTLGIVKAALDEAYASIQDESSQSDAAVKP